MSGPHRLRRFLYITPYFPPLARTGALRPLKFARHLPTHGWAPVVLCDLWQGATTDRGLFEAIPESTIVVHNYSRRAGPTLARLQQAWQRETPAGETAEPKPARPPLAERVLPGWLYNPELLPLGEHSPRIPYALRRGREVLAHFPCAAIVVNADPYAATLVGARLARESGLPLVIDLRDPWAPCELRRPRRPLLVGLVEDQLERGVVTIAARVILNTHAACEAYRDHYADLPSERFDWIRNHCDRALIGDGEHPDFDRFTMLFLGNFGRFIKAETLLGALAELRRRGHAQDALQLVVTGRFGESDWRMARGLGVESMVHLHAHLPYRQIGAMMNAADLLVLLVQPAVRQRLASKFFDYLASERPILAVADNPEQGELLQETGAGVMLSPGRIDAIADHIEEQMALGRQRVVPRLAAGHTSEAASAKLAAILDQVSAGR